MGNHVIYSVKVGLKIAGIFFLLGSFASCASYKMINIDVLKPGSVDLGAGDAQMIFLDRKIIHESDSISALNLFHSLGLKRADLVDCFYEGLQDGLRNGTRPILLIRGLGLSPQYVPDGFEPLPISPQEIGVLKKNGKITHVLAVEYCVFNLDKAARLMLDNNLFVRLYDATNGQIVDSINSRKLGILNRNEYNEQDDAIIICDFFYDKGVKYAERLTPTWIPEKRRVYVGNQVLKVGHHFMENEEYDNARKVWSAALAMKPKVAAQAAVNLAWLYEQEGNYNGARALLVAAQKTLAKGNGDSPLSLYIGEYIRILEKRAQDEANMME